MLLTDGNFPNIRKSTQQQEQPHVPTASYSCQCRSYYVYYHLIKQLRIYDQLLIVLDATTNVIRSSYMYVNSYSSTHMLALDWCLNILAAYVLVHTRAAVPKCIYTIIYARDRVVRTRRRHHCQTDKWSLRDERTPDQKNSLASKIQENGATHRSLALFPSFSRPGLTSCTYVPVNRSVVLHRRQ